MTPVTRTILRALEADGFAWLVTPAEDRVEAWRGAWAAAVDVETDLDDAVVALAIACGWELDERSAHENAPAR